MMMIYIWVCWVQTASHNANYAVHECDVLVLVGARVADRAVVKPYKLERRNTTIVSY